jgi:hypothetical protein
VFGVLFPHVEPESRLVTKGDTDPMPNQALVQRLDGIREMLVSGYNAGMPMSAATKGHERELFIDTFLSQVFTPQYRFGSGDAVDREGNRSGQLDMVIEYPLVPSLPIVGNERPRLYLAEGIAAVVEVKSNLSSQWAEVVATASKLAALKRRYSSGVTIGRSAGERIPLFVAGFTGWKTVETAQQHLNDAPVDGILVVDSGCFVSTIEFYEAMCAGTSLALWAFISCIHHAASVVTSTARGVPIQYAVDQRAS